MCSSPAATEAAARVQLGGGVILLLLTLLLSFTGYLLPWDQLSIWAITVVFNMARAHPFLGYEGPGNQLLTIDGIDMITNASDARFVACSAARFVGEKTPTVFTCCTAWRSRWPPRCCWRSLLARTQRRRNQRTLVRNFKLRISDFRFASVYGCWQIRNLKSEL